MNAIRNESVIARGAKNYYRNIDISLKLSEVVRKRYFVSGNLKKSICKLTNARLVQMNFETSRKMKYAVEVEKAQRPGFLI